MSKKTSNISNAILAFLPAIIWAWFIYYLSSQSVLPSLALNNWDFLLKKTAHIVVYGFLYILLFRAFSQTTKLKGDSVWLTPLIFAVAYAIFDEIHQSYTPGRYGTFRDIGFDTLGCSLVIMQKFGYI